MTTPARVARIIARLNVGGPARHVLSATRGLAPEFDTTLFCGDVGPEETEAADWIAASGVVPERVPGLGRAVRPFDDARALAHLTQRLREMRPDLVHTHTAKAGALGRLAARRAGVPVVVHTFHGHVFDGYFGRVGSAAVVAAERFLARRTDRIVAVSEEVADDLVVRFRIAPRERVVVIAPGIDVARFRDARIRRAEARRALGIDDDTPVIVWAGRIVEVKDLPLAFTVFAALPGPCGAARDAALRGARRVDPAPARHEAEPGDERSSARARRRPAPVLLVAGDGPLRSRLEGSAPPGIRFLGNVADMASLYAAADVALLTSRNEGTPVALIEAAAAGVPAVATRVGGVPSVVAHGETGLLAEHGDVGALASHVASLLADPARRDEMGAAAARRAEARFSEARMLADLRTLYTGLGVEMAVRDLR